MRYDYTVRASQVFIYSGVIFPAHETTEEVGRGRKNEITFCSAKCN